MLGGSSFQLGRIFGIRIGVNASWFLVLFLFLFWLSSRFGEDLDDQRPGSTAQRRGIDATAQCDDDSRIQCRRK